MNELTLLIGGARSGKSALAVEIGRRDDGGVVFIATAPSVDGSDDPDLADRIDRHRAERPTRWSTIEEPTDLAGALDRAGDRLAIIDCLTLWVSNLMHGGYSDDEVCHIAAATARRAARGRVVAVTNEVGSGVHPQTELGRRYRDVLGRTNQVWARAATTNLLLVAGRAVRLDDPWRLLDEAER